MANGVFEASRLAAGRAILPLETSIHKHGVERTIRLLNLADAIQKVQVYKTITLRRIG